MDGFLLFCECIHVFVGKRGGNWQCHLMITGVWMTLLLCNIVWFLLKMSVVLSDISGLAESGCFRCKKSRLIEGDRLTKDICLHFY